jgi:SAM-dependent methyltransferase
MRYQRATASVPQAREGERVAVRAALERLGGGPHQRIVELGSGQGFGTSELLPRLAPQGQLIGVDASAAMMSRMAAHPQLKLHVGALDDMQMRPGSVDFAFSLAAFHHIPNKFIVMQELARVLADDACFMVIDVTHGTPAQEVFDYLVRPYCVSGHDADFLDEGWMRLLAARSGLRFESFELADMDWQFDDRASMLQYVCDLFCLRMSAEEAAPHIERWLKPYRRADGGWTLPWFMGVYLLRKVAQ